MAGTSGENGFCPAVCLSFLEGGDSKKACSTLRLRLVGQRSAETAIDWTGRQRRLWGPADSSLFCRQSARFGPKRSASKLIRVLEKKKSWRIARSTSSNRESRASVPQRVDALLSWRSPRWPRRCPGNRAGTAKARQGPPRGTGHAWMFRMNLPVSREGQLGYTAFSRLMPLKKRPAPSVIACPIKLL